MEEIGEPNSKSNSCDDENDVARTGRRGFAEAPWALLAVGVAGAVEEMLEAGA